MAYVRMALDNRAITYLRDRLLTAVQPVNKYPGSELAAEFLRSQDLNLGETFTFLPQGISEDVRYDFEGGSYDIKRGESIACIRDLIHEYLQSSSANIVVLHDCLSSPETKILKETKARVLFYERQVYHLLSNLTIAPSTIETALLDVFDGWLNIGYFSSLPSTLAEGKNTLDLDLIKLVAARTVTVFDSAYDFDGFVVWRKARDPSG